MSVKSPEEKAANLAAKVVASKSENSNPDANKLKGIMVATVSVAVLSFLAYSVWPSQKNEALKTSESTAFIKDSGDAFGNMKAPALPNPPDPNPELLQKIKDLEAQLASLKNQPLPTPHDDARIAELNKTLDDLKANLAKASSENQQALDRRDTEIQRLHNQLDAIRVANGESVDNEAAKEIAAQQLYEKRIKSPLSPFSGNTNGLDDTDKLNKDTSSEQRTASQNELFARAQAKSVSIEQAKIVANPSRTVLQGTVIQATLETAINTDLPGMIRAIVSEDVQSLDGSRVLIPRGSKVIGKYSDTVSVGQKRVMVMWNRLLLPNDQTVELNSMGSDGLGQSGLSGTVDTHFLQRFGSAALISVIGISPAVATASLSNHNNSNSNGYDTANTLAAAISQNMQSSLGSVIGDYLKRQPTIGVHQGARVTLFVDRDVEIF